MVTTRLLLAQKNLPDFVDSLVKKFETLAPVESGYGRIWRRITEAGEFNTNYVNTIYPAKKIFLPGEEEVLKFKGEEVKAPAATKKRALLGVRPCDANALKILDTIYADETPDALYSARRKNTLTIAFTCKSAGENCFCTSHGTHKLDDGYDLLFTEHGKDYVVEVGSPQGEALTKKKIFKKTKAKPKSTLRCAKKINPKKLAKLPALKSRVWEREAKECLSCAACTSSCPTCACYGVDDRMNLKLTEGARVRSQASCQIKDFTSVAGGHVFREERSERLRQFVLHKLYYHKQNFGVQLCVGCGRCISNCPTGIDLTEMVNAL